MSHYRHTDNQFVSLIKLLLDINVIYFIHIYINALLYLRIHLHSHTHAHIFIHGRQCSCIRTFTETLSTTSFYYKYPLCCSLLNANNTDSTCFLFKMFTSTDLSIYVVLDCSAHVSSASPEEISLKRKRENLNEI